MEKLKQCPYLNENGGCGIWLPQPDGAIWFTKGRGQYARVARLCGAPEDLTAQEKCDRGTKQLFDPVFAENGKV